MVLLILEFSLNILDVRYKKSPFKKGHTCAIFKQTFGFSYSLLFSRTLFIPITFFRVDV